MVTKTNRLNLELTEDEAYTLQILLGFTVDSECYEINKKLTDLTKEEMDTYDYDRIVFSVENDSGETAVGIKLEENESFVIRFK